MHERTARERKTELYGVLLFCITAVQQSLYSPLKSTYYTVADEERMSRRCSENGNPLRSYSALKRFAEFLVGNLLAS